MRSPICACREGTILPGPSSPGHWLLPRESRSDLHGSVEIVSGEYGIRINTISRCVFGIGSCP